MRFEGRGEHAFFFFNPTRSTFVQSGSGGVTARRWPPPPSAASQPLRDYTDIRITGFGQPRVYTIGPTEDKRSKLWPVGMLLVISVPRWINAVYVWR